MYKNIIVAVDMSENSYRAVLEATKLTEEDSFITLLNVRDASEAQREALHGGDIIPEDTIEGLEKQTSLLESKNIQYKLLTKTGQIAKTIIDEANSGSYDVIIVGQKCKVLKDIIIGSVSRRVLKESKIPVLLVK